MTKIIARQCQMILLAFCNFCAQCRLVSDCSDMSDEQFFRCAVVCGLCAMHVLFPAEIKIKTETKTRIMPELNKD